MPIDGIGGDNNPCYVCLGTGELEGEFCLNCMGTGTRASDGEHAFLKIFYDDVMDKLGDIKQKVDETKEVVDAI